MVTRGEGVRKLGEKGRETKKYRFVVKELSQGCKI